MRSSILRLASFVLVFLGVNLKMNAQDKESDELVILSYNIHHANPSSALELINIDTIAAILKSSKADIVGLQEIDVFTERSGKNLHMAKELAAKAGFEYWYFSKSIDFQGGGYGTAILSKFPISDTLTKKLPNPKNAEPRTLSLAKIHIKKDLVITIANTHLDYTDASNNFAQVSALREVLSEEPEPIFVTGDFNVMPNSASMKYLFEAFTSSCIEGCEFTSSAQNPDSTIDYILFKGNKVEVLKHEVLKETYASDHFPVKARFVIEN